jgi:hypothetical protein
LEEADIKALIERLKELGPEQVRSMLATDSFPTGMKREIFKWLSDQAGRKEK